MSETLANVAAGLTGAVRSPERVRTWTREGKAAVGSLIYGDAGLEFAFDDRVLAHLELVINGKLRRRESFMLSWRDTPGVGDGRSSIWMDTAIPLYFRYSGSRMPLIDKEWLEELAAQAGSTRGLVLGEDPATEKLVRSHDNSVKRKDHPAR
ncbi:ATP-dependent DNA ligase [Homoserinibacter sp. GY 40078]|uniref:DUF7882 family protein n=1 Tax=Homoserinibacter sp. GY 40078 TaxID=2603275 RepID=UPI0021028DB0|nr:ATP-dependent DNA ligase [Homoserinibacter sp. GY 40078]